MNSMSYKGYAARIEFDDSDRIFVGHLAGVRDIVGFHGDTVDALEAAFHAAVDDYPEACRKLKQRPERPANGNVLLRIPPELHAEAARAAELARESLTQWAAGALRRAIG